MSFDIKCPTHWFPDNCVVEPCTGTLHYVNIKQLKRFLKICRNKYETEYSGNATLKNIKKISKTGVNRISIGQLTHTISAIDVKLEI